MAAASTRVSCDARREVASEAEADAPAPKPDARPDGSRASRPGAPPRPRAGGGSRARSSSSPPPRRGSNRAPRRFGGHPLTHARVARLDASGEARSRSREVRIPISWPCRGRRPPSRVAVAHPLGHLAEDVLRRDDEQVGGHRLADRIALASAPPRPVAPPADRVLGPRARRRSGSCPTPRVPAGFRRRRTWPGRGRDNGRRSSQAATTGDPG